MIDAKVFKIIHIKGVIAFIAIYIKILSGLILTRDDGHEHICFSVFDNNHKDFAISFQKTKYSSFASSPTTTLTFANTDKIAFIKLYFAVKKLSSFLSKMIFYHTSDFV